MMLDCLGIGFGGPSLRQSSFSGGLADAQQISLSLRLMGVLLVSMFLLPPRATHVIAA